MGRPGRNSPSWTLAPDGSEDVPELPRPACEHVRYAHTQARPQT
ncbi:hypothetical protein BN2537_10705 [Streptomyces venezuelae]|nr:hypothetical protein BN2537_10705 [Streptomyces venezuelae]